MVYRRFRNFLALILVMSLVISMPVPQLSADVTTNGQRAMAAVRHVSVHDPSIIKANGTYYVFGSHLADAKSNDLMSWSQMNVDWNFRGNSWKNDSVYGEILTNLSESFEWAGYNDGDHMTEDSKLGVWAPDVIYNPEYKWSETEKGAYMLYYSASSTWRRSCIGYAVSKNVEGPYQYVDTLIYSGFTKTGAVDGGGNRNTKWNNDYLNLKELIEQKRISDISNKWFTSTGDWNAQYAPNAIDPTVFYGKDGKLYMVYGSWSGGLFILELDKETGDAKYPGIDSTDSTSGNFTDRYFGTHIAGGNHQSGEGPYILYDEETDYYYLYETYGGLTAAGGYNMRMFRSKNIYGPYTDAAGRNAKDSNANNNNYGIKLIGNYSFSNQPGYRAAGHNSAFIDDDGQRYLIFHQRFNQPGNQTEAHEVRVRKQFMNEDNWPVTAVYEYRGEEISHYDDKAVVGEYEIVNHGTSSDGNMIASQSIELYADGSVGGALSGTWKKSTGNGKDYDYITMKVGNITYKGVLYQQYNEENTPKSVMTFSAIGNDNTCLWGTRTGNISANQDRLIYGYDFEEAPVEADRIAPVTKSTKTGQAALVGTAAIEKDAERGNVLHIQNAKGAKQVNYLQLPGDTLSTVTGDGYTVSMWVNAGTDVAAPSALFEANRNGTNLGYPMTRISANLKSHINANGYIDCVPDSESLLTRNQWHHVVYSVNSGKVCTYLDGKQVQEVSKDISGCFDNTNDYSIHKAVHVTVGAGMIWNDEDVREARFDNIAIYNKTLSAEEVDTLHKNDASDPFLNDSLIYGFDFESGTFGGKITPMEESAKTGRAELRGSAVIKKDAVRGNVLYLSNPKGARSNSYLRLPADVLTTVTESGYTVSMWANIGDGTFGHSALFEANRSGTKEAWPMTRISANLIARINASAYSDTKGIGNLDEPFSVNEWHYITYSVSTKGIRLYLDGELKQSTSADLTNCFNSNLNDSIQKAVYTTIGSGRTWDDEDIHEAMFDNVAIYGMALSDARVKELYRAETQGEDPEETPDPTKDPDNPSTPTQDPDNLVTPTNEPENPSTSAIPTEKPDTPTASVIPTKEPDNPSVSTTPGAEVPKPSPETVPPAALKGTVSLAETSRIVTSANTDKGDPKGSVFAALRLNGKGGKKSVKLSWSKVKGAEGYIVYGSACGKKMTEISKVPSSKKSITVKKLKSGKYYKYIVAAYKKIGDETRVFAQSKSVHVCTTGGKVANPTKITTKKKLTLKKGKTKKISAKLKPSKGVKVHIARFRYESTDTKIAAVDKNGKIKAKKKGSCSIYVYSQNGLFVKVKVTVK